jgi:hypothetical protein
MKVSFVPDLDPREMALKCRSLAQGLADDETIRALNRLADEYDAKARILEQKATLANGQPVDLHRTDRTSSQ